MDWTRSIDAYCERTDASLWSEPVNALTNVAFLVAAAIMWQRCAGRPMGRVLAAVLFVIGIGSGLFHTIATAWAAMVDSLPILVFILLYIFAANRTFWRWPVWLSLVGMLAFLPWAAVLTPLFDALPFLAVSSFYWPVPTLILLYAFLLRWRARATARGLALGAGLLIVSLVARSIDETLCDVVTFGTHFLWHILNATMLAWMIEVWRRHPAASR